MTGGSGSFRTCPSIEVAKDPDGNPYVAIPLQTDPAGTVQTVLDLSGAFFILLCQHAGSVTAAR